PVAQGARPRPRGRARPRLSRARPPAGRAHARADRAGGAQVSDPLLGGRVLPVRWLVTLSTLALTVVVVASVGAIAERNTRRALTEELTARLREQASHLAYVSR